MNRYFVGYLIREQAAVWHKEMSKLLAKRYPPSARKNFVPLYEWVPPHVTIFQPFLTNDISPVKAVLEEWKDTTLEMGDIVISGYGQFDNRVIYGDVHITKKDTQVVAVLQNELSAILETSEKKLIWKPHTTLTNFLSLQECEAIWKYLSSTKPPRFVMPFDNITLFRRIEQGWDVEKSYLLA